MSFNYGEVLSKAWKIIWKYKVLWIFGILASCGRSNGGSSNGGSGGGSGGNGSNGSGGSLPTEVERFFNNIEPWMIVVGVLVFIVFILLLIFITNYVSTIGRIGLVKGTLKGDQGAASLTFAELLQTSGPLFWRVFWLNLLAGLVLLFATLLIMIPVLGMTILTMGVGILCLLPLLCLLVPVSWVVSVILEQANISLVIEESSIGDALKRGWEVIKKNVQIFIIMAIILGIISFAASALLLLPVLAAVVPVIGGIALGGMTLGSEGGAVTAIVIALLCCAIYFPLLLVAGGILTGYTTSAWTLTYLRLTRPSAPAPVSAPAPLPEMKTF